MDTAMFAATRSGDAGEIRTLAESWVLCWIHKTPERVGCTATVEDNGAVAEALNALGLEHPGDVIIEPSSYTPDGTPVFTVPPEVGAKHASSGLRTGGGASLTDGRSSACAPSRPECSTS
jgi:hypothetical protein